MIGKRKKASLAAEPTAATEIGASAEASASAPLIPAYVVATSYLPADALKALADLSRHELIVGPVAPDERSWSARRNGRIRVAAVDAHFGANSAAGVVACATAARLWCK